VTTTPAAGAPTAGAPEPAAVTSRDKLAAVLETFTSGYRTVGEMVVDVLRQAIQSGAFAPGEWLRQEYLAEAIGVSRIPVRTALLQLEAEGLVTMHAHRGAQVRVQSPAQIEEIYRLRVLLETYGLRRSMAAMTPERLNTLREFAGRLDAESEGGEFLRARVEFYRALYDNERNPLLVEHIESLRSQLGRYLLGFRFDEHRSQHHGRLVDSVAGGDLDAAESWLRSHLEKVRDGVLAAVRAAADIDKPAHPRRNTRSATGPTAPEQE
jgi:DNA-binding GntR family transcriptional regulator